MSDLNHKTELSCKNCERSLEENDKFCSSCGAEVIHKRLSTRTVISDSLLKALGWDGKLIRTFRTLFVSPQEVLSAYISGNRQRYVKPISFFVLGMSFFLLTITLFHNQYIEISTPETTELSDYVDDFEGMSAKEIQIQEDMLSFNKLIAENISKFFNFYSFALLPIYALLSMLIFGKRYNYAEHVVINSYLQGFLFFVSALIFMIAVFIWPSINVANMLLLIAMYIYAYGNLYELSLGQRFLKLIIFLAVVFGAGLLLFAIGIFVGMLL